ncbi:apolipoprotein N-acyltransferase [Nonomuraea jiangxiensis]|uniref:Apolipoprotein N-acyltransferase n=1 Tax=Nonomuraea jiangxiensis TaxID=633440 RepID=A0A1G8JWS6_9ACTN|nr:apolipoprotein N-acyltransferase [Nonomuraea jiangxiensis]SDI35666.1 apolipoprotein N-acyltransferase [Nonomuraea jiangxiensis]
MVQDKTNLPPAPGRDSATTRLPVPEAAVQGGDGTPSHPAATEGDPPAPSVNGQSTADSPAPAVNGRAAPVSGVNGVSSDGEAVSVVVGNGASGGETPAPDADEEPPAAALSETTGLETPAVAGSAADVREPAAAEPASVERAAAEPGAVERAAAEPAPVEPTPVEPGAAEPAGAGVASEAVGAAAAAKSVSRAARESRWVLVARMVAGVAGGVALYAAFPPLDWWLCAPLGIGLIVAALHGTRPRRAAWLGYLSAVAFLLPTLAWVRTIGDDVWLLLVGVESLFYAAMAALAALVFRLPAWPVWFGALWVAMEWARGLVPIGGFPWARVAFSQGETLFTSYAALGGAPLVSFAVVLCGALLAYAALIRPSAALRRRTTSRADAPASPAPEGTAEAGPAGAGFAVARRAVPVALALAIPVLSLTIPRPGDEGRTINVGIVQGNVPGRGMYVLGDEPAVVLRNHANETKRLAQAVREGKLPKPDIVVLPENSTDIDPYRDEYAREIITDSVRDVGVPTLVGAVVAIGSDERATRSLVWDPASGPGAYYDKQRLVPFGEYTPFKDIVLALSERANLVGRQSVPGNKPGDLKLGPVTIGAVNCYEVAYDDTVRETVRAGGTPLVVQTNNATYAESNLPPQQLAMSQIRAVEHNRAVVTAATTGISAYVTPDGKVSWQTRELVADMNVVKVPVRTQETIATRVGALPEWALMVIGAAAVGVAVWRGRRRGDRMRNDG